MGKRKQSSTINRDSNHLKRFRAGVETNQKSGNGTSARGMRHKTKNTSFRKNKKSKNDPRERKKLRKEARKRKKLQRSGFIRKSHQTKTSEMEMESKETENERRQQLMIERQERLREQQIEKQKKKRSEDLKRQEKKKQQKEEVRKQDLLMANKKDEKVIRQLEKHLHMKKKKTLPKSFEDEGLSYILDALDSTSAYETPLLEDEAEDVELLSDLAKKLKQNSSKTSDSDDDDGDVNYYSDNDGDDNEDEDDDGLEGDDSDENNAVISNETLSQRKSNRTSDNYNKNITGVLKSNIVSSKRTSDKPLSHKSSKVAKFQTDDISDNWDNNDDNSCDDDDAQSGNDNFIDESDDDSVDENDNESVNENDDNDESGSINENSISLAKNKSVKNVKSSQSTKYKEDIYGRLRDKDGNIVTDKKVSGMYIPPGKRLELLDSQDEKRKLRLSRLKRQLKGLINRVSASNVQPISTQIEGIYSTNSRGDVNEVIATLVMEACASPILTPERLVMDITMLLAILNSNVGIEVGAHILQTLAHHFDKLFRSGSHYGDGKEMNNIIVMFAQLYNFKILHSGFIFDIMKRFIDSFGEKDIELLLILLKNVGFSLRKDDAAALKHSIIEIQSKANSVDTSSFEDTSRVRFMLDILMAIRNNDMRKIPNYDPSHVEEMKKLIRNYMRVSHGDNQLNISLEDVLNADEKGRWWLVGSAWEGRQLRQEQVSSKQVNQLSVGDMSGKILALAQKQRMNTDIRRSIFCVIMTSEDFVDAFEKLLRLGLKNQPEREIIHVIVDCCMQEKVFNPFYAYLAQKFCEYDRRFQMTFQFLLWDKFKAMAVLSQTNKTNLAKLLVHLLATKAVSLSVLKVVEFGTLEKSMAKFLKCVLEGILISVPENVVQDVFIRISTLPKLKLLHEGLKLFMNHFILRPQEGTKDTKDFKELKERVCIAEKALTPNSYTAVMF